MMIHVKRSHINQGRPGRCNECPIALALKAKFKVDDVHVDGDALYVGEMTYSTPVKVLRFIERFDDSKTVKPFSFQMPKPHK